MSLCDQCFSPGACCKAITFNFANDIKDADEAAAAMRGQAAMHDEPMPWVISSRVPDRALGDFWRWNCTALGENGRCSIYETRPHPCRSFEPASDALCVHFRGAEAGDPTVGVI